MWIFAGFPYICNVNNLCDLLSSIKAVIISVTVCSILFSKSGRAMSGIGTFMVTVNGILDPVGNVQQGLATVSVTIE